MGSVASTCFGQEDDERESKYDGRSKADRRFASPFAHNPRPNVKKVSVVKTKTSTTEGPTAEVEEQVKYLRGENIEEKYCGAAHSIIMETFTHLYNGEHQWITYYYVGSEIKIDYISDDSFEMVRSKLPTNEPRFIVTNLNLETKYSSNTSFKKIIIMIVWVPDNANAKDKIIYTSSAEALRNKLKLITRKVVIRCIDDLDSEKLAETLNSSEPIYIGTMRCFLKKKMDPLNQFFEI